ncbi:amidohydrolase family protein, partial [Variovorax sp. YR752]|uniref:amidohydrolase family protein n=1 Tax=Variovorax sp. YR752 TaxID=1884383 RepID=UPI003137D7FB
MTQILVKNARLLDPLKPELQDRHDILIEGDTIREVSDRPIVARDARVIDAAGKTVMPGLIDLHVHVVAIELNLQRQAQMPNVLVTLRSLPILRGMLRRGFTTVRDAAGAGDAFKQAVQSGLAQGPRLFVSGRALSQTGGHGDGRARSDYLIANGVCPSCARVGMLARVADGVDA